MLRRHRTTRSFLIWCFGLVVGLYLGFLGGGLLDAGLSQHAKAKEALDNARLEKPQTGPVLSKHSTVTDCILATAEFLPKLPIGEAFNRCNQQKP